MDDDPLEKKIENFVRLYAVKRGFLTYKFKSPNHASVPDRIFVDLAGVTIYCEFKRRGKQPTVMQAREHDRMRKQGCVVHVIDNVADGMKMIGSYKGYPEWMLERSTLK